MRIKSAILFFNFGLFVQVATENEKKEKVLSIFENDLVYKISDFAEYVTEKLASFNDNNLGSSEWGKMIGYDDLKPKLLEDKRKSRGLKKMSMGLMPLIFHVGATSTWMLITSIMATKAVAIGLLLLVFKIAVSSAKVASFFTLLKSKHSEHHHHDAWAWSPPHHGHDRSLSRKEIPAHDDWTSYNPEWAPSSDHHPSAYKTIPSYKESDIAPYEDAEYDESKPPKADKKFS